ncbi:MAG: HEAT repeat domain-containing protein, partial [Planctomycetales bacterium]
LITTHYMTHKLVRSTLIRDGSTFRAEDADFLVSSDPHLRLTDVLEDADGSLLTIDMGAWYTYGFLGNVIPRPEMLGAIYRIRRIDAQPLDDPRGTALRLAQRTPKELIALLDDPRPVVRERAITVLAARGEGAVSELAALLASPSASVTARTNAIWALCRIDAPQARLPLREALAPQKGQRSSAEADSHHRPAYAGRSPGDAPLMAALHAVGLHRDADALPAVVRLLQDESPQVRRKGAETLGRIGSSKAVAPLLEAAQSPVDRFLEHSLIFALIQINDREAVVPGLRNPDPRVQYAALIALDQMADGRLTRAEWEPLLNSSDAALRQGALSVISHRPEWADAAQEVLQEWLAAKRLTDEQQQSLADLLTAGGNDPLLQKLAGAALASAKTASATRSVLLDAVRQLPGNALPAPWAEGLQQALTDRDPKLSWEALAVVRSRGTRQFDDTLRGLGADPALPPELRVAALESLSLARAPLEPSSFDFLVEQLSEATPPLLRLAAARTLAASPLAPEQQKQIAERCREVSTMILRLLVPVIAKSNTADVGSALVAALQGAPAAEALTTAELDGYLKDYPPAVRDQAATLRDKLAARQRDQAAYLARLTAELDALSASADAGKEVFLAPKNNCFACHRAVGRGGTIGPELSKIGQFRTRAELLESIIFPSHAVAPQYQTHTIATRDGRTAAGLVVRETADAISLRTNDLAEIRILRSNIEELAPSSISLMPDGLEKTLTRQQLADLLEFLCQQR